MHSCLTVHSYFRHRAKPDDVGRDLSSAIKERQGDEASAAEPWECDDCSAAVNESNIEHRAIPPPRSAQKGHSRSSSRSFRFASNSDEGLSGEVTRLKARLEQLQHVERLNGELQLQLEVS